MDVVPKVSVIVPVYNADEVIEKSLQCLLNQSEKNIEIILVNDGSEDNSGQICNNYSKNYENIHVIHQENKGPGLARNAGLNIVKGEYIYFMDSDDLVNNNLIRDNYSLGKKNDSDIVIFGYKKTEKLISGKSQKTKTNLKDLVLSGKTEVKNNLVDVLDSGAIFAVWNKLFKTSFIKDQYIQFPDIRRNEDISFTLDSLKYACSISVNSKIYYHYISVLGEYKYDEDLIEQHLYVYDKFFDLYKGWMENSKNRRYAVKLFALYFFHSIPLFIVKYDKDPIEKLKKMLNNDLYNSYLNNIKIGDSDRLLIKAALVVLKSQSVTILYLSTKLKLFMSGRIGKNIFRRFINS